MHNKIPMLKNVGWLFNKRLCITLGCVDEAVKTLEALIFLLFGRVPIVRIFYVNFFNH